MKFVIPIFAAIVSASAIQAQETPQEITIRANAIIQQAQVDIENCQQTAQNASEFETCRQAIIPRLQIAQDLLDKAQETLAHWQLVDTGPSPIDDSPTYTLYQFSLQKNTCGTSEGSTAIVMRCYEGEMAFQFELDGCLYGGLSHAQKTGLIRIDDAPAQQYEIYGSGPVFAPNLSAGAIPLITQMLEAERLVFRAQPFSSPQQTIAFDISGLKEAIIPLRNACGW